ncbi:Copper resistance protein D [bacterium YEK0313]|nr:Copper resistance protein D [bacterium YEK0313]
MILEFWQGPGDPLNALAGVLRAVGSIGALGGAGIALFLLFMSGELTADEATAARRWLFVLVLVGVLASLAAWPLRALSLARSPEAAMRADLYVAIARSRFGDAGLMRLAGLLLVLFALMRRSWATGMAVVGAVTVAASYAAFGHATQYRPRQELAALTVLHVSAAAFWFGSLFPLRNLTLRRDPRAAGEAFLVWSRYARTMVLLALASGLAAAWYLAGPARGLPASWFGWALIAKAALVALLLVHAFTARFRHVRLLLRGDVLAASALRRSLGRQILLGLLVLCVTAELVGVDPPDLGHRLPG